MLVKKIKKTLSIMLLSLITCSFIGTTPVSAKVETEDKKQIIEEMQHLITEANNIGAEVDFSELDLESHSIADLTDVGLTLKFAIECQENANANANVNVNTQEIDLSEFPDESDNSLFGLPYHKYVARQAGKGYEGSTTLNYNGSSRPFSYGLNIYIRYSYLQAEDRFGDYSEKMDRVLNVQSSTGNTYGGIFTVRDFQQKDWYVSKMADSYVKVGGSGRYKLEVLGKGMVNCEVPFSATFDVGDGQFLYESDYPITS